MLAPCADGLSATLPATDMKVHNPHCRYVGELANFGLAGATCTPGNVSPPATDPLAVAPEYGGTCGAASLSPGGSHAARVGGNAHEAG